MNKGWDEAARQGAHAMGRKRIMLTERTDLGSINADTKAGWEGAVPGTKRRVQSKLGRAV